MSTLSLAHVTSILSRHPFSSDLHLSQVQRLPSTFSVYLLSCTLGILLVSIFSPSLHGPEHSQPFTPVSFLGTCAKSTGVWELLFVLEEVGHMPLTLVLRIPGQ